jgi:hypothetical protein
MGQLAFANMKHENILANNIIKIGIYLPRILLLWIFNTSKIALLNVISNVMIDYIYKVIVIYSITFEN